jgi:antitoxin HicB
MMHYRITTRTIDGQIVVRCPALPEFFSYADTRDEARELAVDALITCLQERIQRREDIPQGDPPHAGRTVALPTLVEAKVAVWRALRAEGKTKAALARNLRSSQKQIDRLLNLRHVSPLPQIDAALAALGRRATMLVEPA